MTFHRERAWQDNGLRMSVIGVEEIASFKLRFLDVLRLESCGRNMLFGKHTPFLERRLMLDSAGSPLVGHVVVHDCCVVNDSLVDVGVMDDGSVYIHDGRVVDEISIVPFATYKAHSHVTKPVVHSTVVANVPPPIARMKDIQIVIPSPIRRRPKRSFERGRNPCSRNPIILLRVIVIGPESWSPDEVRLRARWLNVNRKRRWSEADADKYASVGVLSVDQREKCEKQKSTNSKSGKHLEPSRAFSMKTQAAVKSFPMLK